MKPILFNGAMIRAIQDGSKTQTRRPIKGVPDEFLTGDVAAITNGSEWAIGKTRYGCHPRQGEKGITAKYQVGDVLYVRERAIAARKVVGSETKYLFVYQADCASAGWSTLPERIKDIKEGHCCPNGCFRELARIFLKVTAVRVERIKDISEADCIAEGIKPVEVNGKQYLNRGMFANLWHSCYHGSWDRNDFVFVYTFERCDKP